MKKCPQCKNKMGWQEGLLRDGWRDMTKGRYYCTPCRLVGPMKDSKLIIEGKRKSKIYDGISAMDKRITSLPGVVQIGILRERQHRHKRII